MPSAKKNPEEQQVLQAELEAFAVLKAPGGYVAYKLTIPIQGPLIRKPLCEPCHKSLAYQYLISNMNRQLVDDMIADGNKYGQKQAK